MTQAEQQRAKRYADELPYDVRPRWIVVSNFTEIHVHDMNQPHSEPEILIRKNAWKVKINQFYGIEINDFAVTVAKTACFSDFA